jgi:hypothetical protein
MINCKCERPDSSHWSKEQIQEISNILQCNIDEIRAIEIVNDEILVERTFIPVEILKVTQLASFKKELL